MIRFFIFSIIIFRSFAFGQVNWLYTAGSEGNDEVLDAVKSTNTQIYSTGYYSQEINFGSSSFSPMAAGDFFLTCQDANGNYLWSKKGGGVGGDRGTAISRSANGNIIVTGFVSGTVTFESTTLSTNAGSQDIFVASYNENTGLLNWVEIFGGDGIEIPYDVTTDQLNNIIVTGQFKGTATFGASTFSSQLNSSGIPSYDIFVLKLSPLGTVTWAKQGKAKNDDRGMCLTTDASENIYLAGQFTCKLPLFSVQSKIEFCF